MTDKTISRSLASILARYFWVSPYNQQGHFSPSLFLYSSTCLAIVAILNFTAAIRIVYTNVVAFDGFSIFNNSFGLSLDFLMFGGLSINISSQFHNKFTLERICSQNHAQNPVLPALTVVTTILTLISLIIRYFELTRDSSNDQNIDHLWYSFYCVVSFIYYLIAAQYCAFLGSLSYKIQIQTQAIDSKMSSRTSLYVCIQSHNDSVADMKLVHNIYDKQICCVILDVFADCVFNGYFVIMYSILGDEGVSFGIGYGAGIVVKLLTLLVTCMSCSNAKFHADAFNRKLFKLVAFSNDLCHDKKLVMVVTSRRTVNFTAGGFVGIGNELIVSMLAAITTYLVMLVSVQLTEDYEIPLLTTK